MKVVILAGGFGTRISEESYLKPKPMVEIGEKPIIWHIMKYYSNFGFNEFIICGGYKQHIIKEWFANYYLYGRDITFNFLTDTQIVHNNQLEPWIVTVVDTGLNTMTGGRIKKIEKYIGNESFMLTYGDAVSDVNIEALIKQHKESKCVATLTSVQLDGRFGILDISTDNIITNFKEKKKEDTGWINAGFMVLEPKIFDLIEGDTTVFERYPLEELARRGLLGAYRHEGFWQCMDTLRDKEKLEKYWNSNKAPWKVWE